MSFFILLFLRLSSGSYMTHQRERDENVDDDPRVGDHAGCRHHNIAVDDPVQMKIYHEVCFGKQGNLSAI